MVDIFIDVFHDLFEGASVPAIPAPGNVLVWDGVNAPRLEVLLGLGGTATSDPQGGHLILDQGPGLDIGTLGDVSWTDITDDVASIRVDIALAGEIDSAEPNRMTATIDKNASNYDPTNLSGPYVAGGVSLLDAGIPIWFRTIWHGVVYPVWRGYIDDVIVGADPVQPIVRLPCVDELETLGRAKLLEASPVGAGETTGARIGRVLDVTGRPASLRQLDTGQATCQATSFGDFALQLIQQAIDTELGFCYADPTGMIVFWDRWHTWTAPRSLTVQATFSGAGTDIDLPPGPIEVSTRDRSTVFNDAAVTRDGGTEQHGGDPTSQARYGIRTLPGSYGTLLQTDTAAVAMAQWLGGIRFTTPAVKLDDLQIQAHTQAASWATLLGLRLLDRVRALLNYGPNTIDQQVLLQGISHDIGRDHWTMTVATRQPDRVRPMMLDIGPGLDTAQLGF